MTEKENGQMDEQVAQTDDIENGAGWLFRKIQEGWLRKRWRKRWCLIRDGKLYFFEFTTTDKKDKNCGVVDLSLYQNCVKASKKEAEKKPNIFILETLKTKPGQKTKTKVQREMFYTETSDVMEKWYQKLNEAISSTRMGGDVKLNHVTKMRAKPAAAKRRPPSRTHLKERALTSEMDIEAPTVPTEPKKRGHVPSSAIKPPPLGLKVKSTGETTDVPSGGSNSPTDVSLNDLPSPLPLNNDKPPVPLFSDKELPEPPQNGDFPEPDTNENEDLPLPSPLKDGETPLEPSVDNLPIPPAPLPPSKSLKPKVEGKNSLPPSPLIPKEMLDKCSPTSSRGSSFTGSVQSLNSVGSAENDSGLSNHGSFKRDNVDQRAELLKTKVLQTLKLSEESSTLTKGHRSRSMAYLDDIDNDLPPPPELPEGYSEIEPSLIIKKGKKEKKKKKKRPASLIFN